MVMLILSAMVTTMLASLRQVVPLGVSSGMLGDMLWEMFSVPLWFHWLESVTFGVALFGCTAFLGQSPEALRRAFRLIATLFGISVILLFLFTFYRIDLFALPYLSIPLTQRLHLYWDGSYSGIAALFVPLMFAAYAKGIGRLENVRYHRIFWCCWTLATLLLFLYSAWFAQRRIVGAILLVCLIVGTVAVVVRYSKKRYGILLSLITIFAGAVLFVTLYNYNQHSPKLVSDCLLCNEMFLPLWLVDAPRQIAWQEILALWQEHPWFGIGIHNETTVLTHPHSRFLQILGGLGLFGFALFITILGISCFKSLCVWKKNKTGAHKGLCLLLVHSVYWTGGFFDLSIWSVWHFCMYTCAIVMSLSLDRLAEARA